MWKKSILRLVAAAVLLQATACGQERIAPLDFKKRTLLNGLTVITLKDNSSPTVSVQVWYKVGSKDDPEGRSGFAHLFEHLMFKSTKNMKSEMFDRLTEDVGGANNASTADDRTEYHEVIPSNYLETLIWAEADRMVNLNVDEANFKSERDVVKEEYRQSVLAQPYGKFFDAIQKRSYSVHPYMRPTIGNIEELNAASLEDVRAFYRVFYRPDNATLIVAGDFEQAQLDGWIDKYFGQIKQNKMAIPRVTTKEPPRTAERRFVERAPNVPLPGVAITYLAPPSASADSPALAVAQAILSGGESARIYQSLVYKQQIAQEAAFMNDEKTDGGLLIFYAIAASGKQLADVEKALLTELNKIQTAPPSAAEVEKAKNVLITQALSERETNEGKATAIGNAIIYGGAAETVNSSIEKLQKVTAADVQNVMKKYFTDNNRVVIYYQNEEGNSK
jgi:zinc protease